MSGGSLYDFVHKQHNVLNLTTLLKFAVDVCRGMCYLHERGIIHRDLKTANLLMDKDRVCIASVVPSVFGGLEATHHINIVNL